MGDEVRVRFPTLEVFSALHGGALSLGGRPLYVEERRDAAFIFGSSINLDKVRVVNAVVANAPTTLGNFIRISMNSEGCCEWSNARRSRVKRWRRRFRECRVISIILPVRLFKKRIRQGAW